MRQDEEQDTRETEALAAGVRFDTADAEAVGDPAAASVDSTATPLDEPVAEAPAGAGGWEPPAGAESPVDADRRGAEQAPEPPLGEMAGAFVGAFVAAKVLKRLGGGSGD